MLGLKVPKRNAERVRRYLARQKLMDINYRIISCDEFIYFPILRPRPADRAYLARSGASLSRVAFKATTRKAYDYRSSLRKALGEDYKLVSKGYDTVGSIAIIDSEAIGKAKRIGKVIMELNKNIKTVVMKGGPVAGRFRRRKYRFVAGKRRYEALYAENGAIFKVDIRRSFFSPRLAYERERINRLVGRKEKVMVMFAGVGPFAIEIAKRHRDASVVGIELNREAYKSMVENIKLNRVENFEARLGDVNKVAVEYRNFADRIVMPLPKDSYGFLGAAVCAAGRSCIVHYYAFGNRDTAFALHKERLGKYFKGLGIRFEVLLEREVRTYSPSEIEIVIDFRIKKPIQ